MSLPDLPMKELFKSLLQFTKILLLCLFLLFFPLVPSSTRTLYLYFLLNLLIVALAFESGLLRPSPDPPVADKKPVVVTCPPIPPTQPLDRHLDQNVKPTVAPVLVAAPAKKDQASTASRMKRWRRCPSRPSLFFISGGEDEGRDAVAIEEDLVAANNVVRGEISRQELFTRAEAFIGNFYRQLKMQREESWKKIHGLYPKTF